MILLELQAELVGFFHGTIFLLERTTNRQCMVIQNWAFGIHFLKISKARLSLQKKTIDSMHCQMWSFKQKLEFWTHDICCCEPDSLPALKEFPN